MTSNSTSSAVSAIFTPVSTMSQVSQTAAKPPLDNLLAGYSQGIDHSALHYGSVNNNKSSFPLGPGSSPDGPLLPPQAIQESLMFLKPAQVKGEGVL